MAIYRGIGGAGDSTTDATITAVTEQAANAAASASAAASSATAAASSATAASTAQTAAETAETAAETAQAAAETAETNAETAESNAAASASAAATSASNASTSETNAATSATAASTSATAAASSATSAASSATSASTSASNASTSESNAASSASAASTSATNAATSATAAGNAQTAAEAAQAAAEAAQEAIDGLYLGAQTSDPTLDNNGDPVTAGDWYYNTTTAVTRIYDGSAWNNGAVSTVGFLQTGNNLSDLGDAATARTNLGLGTAATTASTDYATAAQGSLADSATQPGDNISTLTNDSGFITASDDITGNAATATNATNVSLTNTSTNANFFIPFASGNTTANYALGVDSGVYYNPSNNTLGVTTQTVSDGINFNDTGRINFGASTDARMFYDGGNNTMELELEAAANSFIITDNGTIRFTFDKATGNFTATGTLSASNLNVNNWDTAYSWGNHASAGYLTNINGESIENLSDVNTMTPTDGQVLTWDNANSRWDAADASGGGATGGGSDAVFYENEQTVTTNYTISTNKSAMSAGPITINSGVTVTVPTGSRWVVV